MYCTPPVTLTARKPHRCTNCAGVIEIGAEYQRWMSVDDGSASTNKMHPECLVSLQEEFGSGYWEYTLYGGERPDADTLEDHPETVAAMNDAERYRKLRRGQHWSVIDGIGDTLRAEALDAAVDAVPALPANVRGNRPAAGGSELSE